MGINWWKVKKHKPVVKMHSYYFLPHIWAKCKERLFFELLFEAIMLPLRVVKEVKSFTIRPWHESKIAYWAENLLFKVLGYVDLVALPWETLAGNQSEWEILPFTASLSSNTFEVPCQTTSPCRRQSSRRVSVGCHSRRKKRVLPVYLSLSVTWLSY